MLFLLAAYEHCLEVYIRVSLSIPGFTRRAVTCQGDSSERFLTMPSRRLAPSASGKSQAEPIDISSGEDDFGEVEVDKKPYGRSVSQKWDLESSGGKVESFAHAPGNGETSQVGRGCTGNDAMDAREAIMVALAKLDAEVSPCHLAPLLVAIKLTA